ncbi:MAG: sodium ion-translocating decarboxylase subunit beta, partial [Clostridia bacterium]|nr:sodium ion-translocating decarboxylase subunit beta [Clostridia bacterium]
MGFMNGSWQNYIMLVVSFVLMYLAIVKKYEPLLLLPIAFGMFLINIPGAEAIVWGKYDYDVNALVALGDGTYLFTQTGDILTAVENGIFENAEGLDILQAVYESGTSNIIGYEALQHD